ncbi:MAG: alkaline phosphatase D family protein, partial [Verrucomicrobiota bacterium]
MLRTISRRLGFKLVGVSPFAAFSSARSQDEAASAGSRLDHWDRTPDRVFLGGSFWANPMEDWQIREGWAQCRTTSAGRNIHSLTHTLDDPRGGFSMSVRMAFDGGTSAGGGFQVGGRGRIDDHRCHAFSGGGVFALWLGDSLELGKETMPLPRAVRGEVLLTLQGSPMSEGKVELTLTAASVEGDLLGVVSTAVSTDLLRGNLRLVSQAGRGAPKGRNEEAGFRFTEWRVGGEGIKVTPENEFGPILWSMYSLSDSRSEEGFVLKLSALTGPMATTGTQEVELEVEKGGSWQSLGKAELDQDAWVATFRIAHWDETQSSPFRVTYKEGHRDGSSTPHQWTGTIRANPERVLRMGALTCQKDYAFPYAPVAENLSKLDLDLLFFSGDQLYEGHGGFGVIREPAEPAILNFLRKQYMFGWAFREPMRHAPTLCIPDDHDVFHGNIWGEAGAKAEPKASGTSSRSGYVQPAKMVNVVHQVNCGHHPDFYDPTPVKQDISVYYGDMVYGGVSFAIIGDRQWKSGPGHVYGGWEGRPDHIKDPDFDTSTLDREGLVLLGERQEEFLREWSRDWRGHSLKVLLSQTVFSGMATHHGRGGGMYLKADLDSSGWPQTPRNNAINILRESMALHINGDQHLASLSQYGVNDQRDSNWAYCTPAIAAGYPRWWLPDELGMPLVNRPAHGLDNTGEYLDGLGNKTYVYAVGNPPRDPQDEDPYELAHQKGSGFGVVTMNTEAKTYELHAYRFLIDATEDHLDNQFPGWPVL